MTGKKHKYDPYLQYTKVKRWSTGADFMLEPAQINHEIYVEIYAAEPLDKGSGTSGA